MITHLHPEEIRRLLQAGAGVMVSAASYQPEELKAFARLLEGSAVLHITKSSSLRIEEMTAIARLATAPAYVMFSGRMPVHKE